MGLSTFEYGLLETDRLACSDTAPQPGTDAAAHVPGVVTDQAQPIRGGFTSRPTNLPR
jgi:hypothetical protein